MHVRAGVAELADAADLNSAARKGVRVRISAPALILDRTGDYRATRLGEFRDADPIDLYLDAWHRG